MKAIALLLIASMAFGAVNYNANTCHITEAQAVNDLIIEWGVYSENFSTWIFSDSQGTHYAINFPYIGFTDDAVDAAFMISVAAVAVVSEEANWTSSYLVIGFDGGVDVLTTADARYFNNNALGMTQYQKERWIASHVVPIPD